MTTTVRRRRRNIGACDSCRSRRTKCDGSRPKCGTCAHRGVNCVYPEVLRPTQSRYRLTSGWRDARHAKICPRLEADISTIRDQLDNIVKLFFSAHKPGCCLAEPVPAAGPATGPSREQDDRPEQLGSSSLPVMVIQNAAFMKLVGLESDLAQRIADAERATLPALCPLGSKGRGSPFRDFNLSR